MRPDLGFEAGENENAAFYKRKKMVRSEVAKEKKGGSQEKNKRGEKKRKVDPQLKE